MNYTTFFDHKNNSMEIWFGNGYKIIADFNLNMAYKLNNREVKSQFSIEGMSLAEFHQILLSFERSVS